jgi:hypothetical protein
MKPDTLFSLNKIESSFYDKPPIEAAKPLLKKAVLDNYFLDDINITDTYIINQTAFISMTYTPKFPLKYINFNFVIPK